LFKKIIITILFALTLFNFGLISQPLAYAQSAGINDPNFTFDLTVLQNTSMKSNEKQNWMMKGINFLFERGISIMAGTIGTAAVLMMVIGGVRMMLAGAKEEEFNKGKSMMMRAGIGLVVVLSAYILVTTVQLLIKSIFQ
jgi:hypothetical protein